MSFISVLMYIFVYILCRFIVINLPNKKTNLSVILNDEAIILSKKFQCVTVLLQSIYLLRTVKVFMNADCLILPKFDIS